MKIRNKLFLIIFTSSLLIFSFVIVYIINNYRNYSLKYSNKQISDYTFNAANLIKTSLEKDLMVCKTISHGFKTHENIPTNNRNSIYINTLKNIIESNTDYLSLWIIWESKFIDKTNNLDTVRLRTFVYKNKGIVSFVPDTVKINDKNFNNFYHNSKQSNLDLLTNPYYYTFNKTNYINSILKISIATPIIINDEFAGQVGIDISPDKFEDLIKSLHLFNRSELYLLSSENEIISSSKLNSKKHNDITKLYPALSKLNTKEQIKRAESFSLNFVDSLQTTYFATFSPISIGNAQNSWSICVIAPKSEIEKESKKYFTNSIIAALIGIAILSIISYLVANKISSPIKKTNIILSNLSKGIIDKSNKLESTSKDELSERKILAKTCVSSL